MSTHSAEKDAALSGFRVTVAVEGAHPLHVGYPLLPGDLLVRDSDGTWTKEAPGLAVIGFVLSDEQEATLKPVTFECSGLSYHIFPPEASAR